MIALFAGRSFYVLLVFSSVFDTSLIQKGVDVAGSVDDLVQIGLILIAELDRDFFVQFR